MVRRRFVDLDYGQVHYREFGAGGRPLVMLHSNPTSARALEPLMRHMGLDRHVIAPDTPGFGDSDPLPVAEPNISDFAAAIGAALDKLGLERVDLYGTHTGANIALELALARPQRTGRLILDAIALYREDERADLLAHYAPERRPVPDGSHLLWAWHFMRDQSLFWPWFRREAGRRRDVDVPDAETLHGWVVDVLKAIRTYHAGYRASFRYAKEERLGRLTIPTLVASSVSDIFFDRLEAVARLVPRARTQVLPPTSDPAYLEKAAGVFRAFLDA